MKTLDSKLDKIIEDINEIKVTQAEHTIIHQVNSTNLAEHMRRTTLNEQRIASMEEIVNLLRLGSTIFSYVWKAAIAVLGIAGTILGVVLALKELGII
jgi:hypothetical protein